jgi:rfaE bifunctional protein kinase chain/domain
MSAINQLRQKTVLVAGDFMLDVYTIGQVKRISPEAPVPVLCVTHQRELAGGAGNAVLNLISLGMKVKILGRIGPDAAGLKLKEHLKAEGADVTYLLEDPDSLTPQKNRMMADNHQLLRVDYENPQPLSAAMQAQIIPSLPKLLRDCDVVAISDYGKGFLTPTLLQEVIQTAAIPVIVDPKGRDFSRYRGAFLLKPNLSEAITASGLEITAPLQAVAKKIIEDTQVDSLVITRSEEGMSIFKSDQSRWDYPAKVQQVRDVTGAGDTVLAVMTACLANKLSLNEAAEMANYAAAIAISRVGCARVSLKDLHELAGL